MVVKTTQKYIKNIFLYTPGKIIFSSRWKPTNTTEWMARISRYSGHKLRGAPQEYNKKNIWFCIYKINRFLYRFVQTYGQSLSESVCCLGSATNLLSSEPCIVGCLSKKQGWWALGFARETRKPVQHTPPRTEGLCITFLHVMATSFIWFWIAYPDTSDC